MIISQYFKERPTQLFSLFKILSQTSFQKEVEKEQSKKICDIVSIVWWQNEQLGLETYPILQSNSFVYRIEFNTLFWKERK